MSARNQAADAIWLQAIDRLGWRLERSDEVFASWDGDRTLTICTPAGFDPDDCLAQMVLHEICHALTQGPDALARPDWGMENIDDRDLSAEYACHRLQAALTAPYGLRDVLQPTTEHRPYYLGLPTEPLQARDHAAWRWAHEAPWADVLDDALEQTAVLARQHADRTGTIWARFTEVLDCRACGACCREGFHRVEVDDLTLPGVEIDTFGAHLPRPDGRCVHLSRQAPWTCAIYEGRPTGCSELPIGGDSCWEARKRVKALARRRSTPGT